MTGAVDAVALLADSGGLADLLPPATPAGAPGHPGGVLALAHAGTRSAVGFGLADLGHRTPIGAGTVFDSASIAKQFTAAAVLSLADRGAVDLDDRLLAHLPELGSAFAPVRLRHLLYHTSGVRDYQPMLALAGARRRDYFGVADVLGLLSRQRSLAYSCGTRHMYSNSNYVLLAEVVERVADIRFGAFLADHVLRPAGLVSTSVRDDPARVVADAACSYRRTNSGYEVEHTPTDVVGDSGLLTTAADLLTWGERLRTGTDPVSAAMRAPGALDDGTPLRYGHGLVFRDWADTPGYGHGGSFDGFRAELVVVPRHELTAVVLANWSGADPAAVLRGVLYRVSRPAAPASPAGQPRSDWPPLLLDGSGLPWRLRPGTGGRLVLLGVAAQAILTQAGPDELRGVHEEAEVVIRRADEVYTAEIDGRVSALSPADPGDLPDLTALAGSYWSEELATTAVVTEDGACLRWRRRSSAEDLTWVAGAVFHAGNTWVVFDREPGARAHALGVHTSRVGGLRFERRG